MSQADLLAGTSATDEPRLGQLSEFGREVVVEVKFCDKAPAVAAQLSTPATFDSGRLHAETMTTMAGERGPRTLDLTSRPSRESAPRLYEGAAF